MKNPIKIDPIKVISKERKVNIQISKSWLLHNQESKEILLKICGYVPSKKRQPVIYEVQ
jgi:hypothetical protein